MEMADEPKTHRGAAQDGFQPQASQGRRPIVEGFQSTEKRGFQPVDKTSSPKPQGGHQPAGTGQSGRGTPPTQGGSGKKE